METTQSLKADERRERIREALLCGKPIVIGELARRFAVSEMTVRRDLQRLEDSGEVRRTHGGAVPTERMLFEFDFAARRSQYRAAKRTIAAEAVTRIEPGQRLILDNGTTTLELAMLLKDFPELTVVTPSLAVAAVLQFSEGIDTILLGGLLRRGHAELTGIVTEKILSMFSVDIAFQGADGIGLDGRLYTGDPRVAEVDRRIRSCAARTYVLADSSKVGQTALLVHGSLAEAEALITDAAVRDEDCAALEKTGVAVIRAEG
ncbi:DeoR/GlpR family DNA-binding transcription regulator [Kiritimatiella glycovorans]|uniref:DeoR family transcriptional repressor n=1 Tax=Kiritimatiella glycovorans TaxID=1307763 RepID=A0A0G3EHK0_9BACT|nr:DeoR/GlpR family DNA-binding transcription regulator [Kiritimatiella glycovorans]AKJ63669.1 DeoR family transcriptional repressor [Kiritimatiella glycovorans]